MNFKMVFHVVGKMIMLLAALLILPTIVSVIYHEPIKITNSFFSTIFICFILSLIICIFKQLYKFLNKDKKSEVSPRS